MNHRLAIAAVAAATLALAGCSSDNGDDKPGPPRPQGQAPAANTPTTPAAAPGKADQPPAPVAIGQPVTLLRSGGSGITMTALQIQDPAMPKETYGKAPAGTRLVAVQWKVAASGTLAISSSPAMGSSVIDSDGQEYPILTRDITAGTSMPLSVSIAAGDSRLGWVTYSVPDGVKIVKVQYSPGLGLAADTGTWTT